MLEMLNYIKMVHILRSMHAWDNNHLIDFESAKVVDKGRIHNRLTLESWHTASDKKADNNSKPLPPQYRALINRS